MRIEETNMNRAYLLTGGNLGDRKEFLARAEAAIEKDCGPVRDRSAIYETEAWGLRDQDAFLNQALEIETELDARELLQRILLIEEKLGRKRAKRYGPRTIDIDILFFNRDVIQQEGLVVPHAELQNRRFALVCLNDIIPHFVHPVLQKTVLQLLSECTDPLTVHKIN